MVELNEDQTKVEQYVCGNDSGINNNSNRNTDRDGINSIDQSTSIRGRKKVISVKVSPITQDKAAQLERFQRLSSAKRLWGKDQKLLQCNLLLVPTSTNYTVVLALGRERRELALKSADLTE